MKTRENTVSAHSLAEAGRPIKRTVKTGLLMAGLLMVFLAPFNAVASSERYVLNFNDSQIRGHAGQPSTLLLKKSLKQQYPSANVSNMELRRVVLVAKSKMGRGGAQLRVANRATPTQKVDGHPRSFQKKQPRSFDRIGFRNPSNNSRGPWQVNLKGNLIVRKVVLEVQDHSRPRYQKEHRHYNGKFAGNW